MKPPPPILPARGKVTASAKPTPTAASTALPPCCKISRPTAEASASCEATMPFFAQTGCWMAFSEKIASLACDAGAGPCSAVTCSESDIAATSAASFNIRVEDIKQFLVVDGRTIPAKADYDVNPPWASITGRDDRSCFPSCGFCQNRLRDIKPSPTAIHRLR